MTYKEYYLACETQEELLEKAEADIKIALCFNPDRVEVIRKSADEALLEKFPMVGEGE